MSAANGGPSEIEHAETPPRTFTCAVCGGTFYAGQTEEEARAELERRFPGTDVSHCAVVCDECDKDLRERSAAFWKGGVFIGDQTGGPKTP